VADLFRRDRYSGLERLPHVGKSIARKLGELIRRGRLRSLESLRRKTSSANKLTTLPMVGPLLAERIRRTLGIGSLEEVYAAAYDGRLQRVAGVGRKRVQAIRECLTMRLNRTPRARPTSTPEDDPPIAVLLEIDRRYREKAAEGRLIRVAPRRFNPTGAAWLPILRVRRHGHRYCAMFANTARSHQLGHVHDWVVIVRDSKQVFGSWTVMTAQYGLLQGKRIVRGRESECRKHYAESQQVQLNWLAEPAEVVADAAISC
jgi:hypothetical protein